MDGDLTRLVELAAQDARRRRHEAAAPEHLLGVALRAKGVARALLDRGLDPAELGERLEMQLTARDEVGGYRDGSDAPRSPELERVLARIARRPWRPWRPFASTTTLLDALLLERLIAALVFDLRRGNDYRHLLERARALAITSGHMSIGVEHLFRVLLDVRSFIQTLERAGGAAPRLLARVDAALDAMPRLDALDAPPTFDAVLRESFSCGAEGAYAGGTALSVREACLELARRPESDCLWAAAGIRASDFRRAVHVPSETARGR